MPRFSLRALRVPIAIYHNPRLILKTIVSLNFGLALADRPYNQIQAIVQLSIAQQQAKGHCWIICRDVVTITASRY